MMKVADKAGEILRKVKRRDGTEGRSLFRTPEVRERIPNDSDPPRAAVGPAPESSGDKILTELNEMQDLECDQHTGEY